MGADRARQVRLGRDRRPALARPPAGVSPAATGEVFLSKSRPRWTTDPSGTTVELMSRSCLTSGGAGSTGATFAIEWTARASARLAGELDLAALEAIRREPIERDEEVELECSQLTFIDASGLRLLLAADRGCESRGGKVAIVNPAQCVTRLLALTGLDDVLTVRRTTSSR